MAKGAKKKIKKNVAIRRACELRLANADARKTDFVGWATVGSRYDVARRLAPATAPSAANTASADPPTAGSGTTSR